MDPELSGIVSTLGQTEAHYKSNALGMVGCILSVDEEMPQTNNPQVSDHKPRSWKRLVTDRAHAEVQITPMQRKQNVRDEENETEVGVMGKKFYAMDTTHKQMAKAAGQPC